MSRDVTPLFKTEARKPKPRRPLPKIGKKGKRDRRELVEAKAQVLLRSKGRCEATRLPHVCELASQFHHIQRRSAGGSNDPANLLHVCTPAHMRIHAMPDLARELGYLAPWEPDDAA